MMSHGNRSSPLKDITNRLREQGRKVKESLGKRNLSIRSRFKKSYSQQQFGFHELGSLPRDTSIVSSDCCNTLLNEESPEATSKYVPGQTMKHPSPQFFQSPLYKRGRKGTPSKNPVAAKLFQDNSNLFCDPVCKEFEDTMDQCVQSKSIKPFE